MKIKIIENFWRNLNFNDNKKVLFGNYFNVLSDNAIIDLNENIISVRGNTRLADEFFYFLGSHYLPPNIVRSPNGNFISYYKQNNNKNILTYVINNGLNRIYPENSIDAKNLKNAIQYLQNIFNSKNKLDIYIIKQYLLDTLGYVINIA